MGKYISISAVFMAILGFIIIITLKFTGDTQSHSIIEPVNASVTLGEMRTNPHNTYQLNEDSYGLVGEKGMLASDFMAEVTNGLIDSKQENSLYVVWWMFKDSEGNLQDGLKPSIVEAGREGDFKTNETLYAKDIIESQLGTGMTGDVEDSVRDAVIHEAIFKVNRYDNSQIYKEGDQDADGDLAEVGEIRDLETPINSTTYKWSLFTSDLADEDYKQGEGFDVENKDFEYHTDAGVNNLNNKDGGRYWEGKLYGKD